MIDLKQTPKQIAIDLINDANGTTYTTSSVSLSTPSPNQTVINGLNTTITLTQSTTQQSIGVNLFYNRLDFKTLLERPYCQLEDNNLSRIVDLVPYLNDKYQINLQKTDLVDGPYRPDDIATGIRKLTVQVTDNHYVYTGSATIYLGNAETIYNYFNQLQYQISADFNTIAYRGGNWSIDGRTVIDANQSFAQRTGVSALYLCPTGKIIPSKDYHTTTNPLLARFRNNRLYEVLGLNGETSYDASGKLLPRIPAQPVELNAIPETLGITAALNNGAVTYSLGFDVSTKKAGSGSVFYVDNKAGLDTNDGSTEATAFRTFRRALNALPPARVIRVKGNSGLYYDVDSGWSQTVRNRTLDVIGYGDVAPIFTATRQTTDWTLQTTNVWFTTVTDVAGVVDKTVTNTTAGYGRMLQKTTIDDVTSTPHSFYLDTITNKLYIHLTDNRKPDTDVFLITKALSGSVADKSILYIENCQFDLGYNGFIADMTVPKTYGYLYLNNCQFGWTFKDTCFGSYGFNVASQNCQAKFGYAGGFRYSSDRVLPTMGVKFWVIENSAVVANCGFDGNHTSPASWVSANGTALRINSTYSGCDGHHGNDSGDTTFSLNIACHSTAVNNTAGTLAHFTVGVNSTLSASAQYWSCTTDTSAFSYIPKGVGKIALFDSDIGAKPATGVLSPYRFIYTA